MAPNIAFAWGAGEGYDPNQNERTGHLTWMVVILSDPGISMFFLKLDHHLDSSSELISPWPLAHGGCGWPAPQQAPHRPQARTQSSLDVLRSRAVDSVLGS